MRLLTSLGALNDLTSDLKKEISIAEARKLAAWQVLYDDQQVRNLPYNNPTATANREKYQEIVDILAVLNKRYSDSLKVGQTEKREETYSSVSTISSLKYEIDVLNRKLYLLSQSYQNGVDSAVNNQISFDINKVNTQISSLTNSLTSMQNVEDKKTAEYNASPTGIAKANKTAADSYRAQMFFFSQPGQYDYGRGAAKRNDFYKGLGDIMIPKTSHSLYNLYRQDGLAGLFDDILSGGRVALKEFKSSGSKLPAMPNIPGGIKLAGISAPSWLTNMGKAVLSGAKDVQARRASSRANVATGGSQYVEPQAPAPNYLAWGVAALAVGLASVALRGKR